MQEIKKPITRIGFTNIYGKYFPNVREIAFYKGYYLNIGNPITSSHQESAENFISDDKFFDSMYIYQDRDNPVTGYRIYDSYNEYHFNGKNDDVLIQNLQERQSNVLLTKFPTGVVTYGGFIIGQEMPFFPNCKNIDDYLKKCSLLEAFNLYKQLLSIFKELYNNGITYTDIHSGNFLVTTNAKIELIDFDNSFVQFDTPQKLKTMIINLYSMINNLSSSIYNITSLLDIEKLSFDFDVITEELAKKEKILIKE